MLEQLAHSIRTNNFDQFKKLMADPHAQQVIDRTFELTQADHAALASLDRHILSPLKNKSRITDARLIFLTILYDRMDMFIELAPRYLKSCSTTTMTGVTLSDFALSKNLNYGIFLRAVLPATSRNLTASDRDREVFISAAQYGDPQYIQVLIALQYHLKDTEGDALSIALQNGKTSCAERLATAFLSFNNKIQPRHYFAAGCAQESQKMYYLLPKETSTQSTTHYKKKFSPPDFIREGNLSALKNNMSKDPDELSSWLFHAVTHLHMDCVKYLLSQGVEIKPKHYFAAGEVHKHEPTQGKKFFDFLIQVDSGKINRNEILKDDTPITAPEPQHKNTTAKMN